MSNQVNIEESWANLLASEFEQPYFEKLKQFLKTQKEEGKIIYPAGSKIFEAFNQTPVKAVKIVLIGQDPYHGKGQANGLCFSVAHGVAVPPSLKNIYKELANDIAGYQIPNHGNLLHWAQQGVLMLNATLTVEENKAGSHQGKGWEIFTDRVIATISEQKSQVVFLLWGKFAQSKKHLIQSNQHLVLEAAHPSPFSAHQGFLGCKHFSKANDFLIKNGLGKINW